MNPGKVIYIEFVLNPHFIILENCILSSEQQLSHQLESLDEKLEEAVFLLHQLCFA